MEKVILSFFDSLLHDSDLSLLEKKEWLNDTLIGFSFEYFEREKFNESAESIAFVSPDVTQFIKLASGSDVAGFVEPLGLGSKQLVFLVVNDQQSADETGGTHWSLLVYSRAEGEFQHYDSSGDSNLPAARALARKLSPALHGSGGRNIPVVSKPTPQQTNGCDCGVYVICVTEQLCRIFTKQDPTGLHELITPEYATQYRHKLKTLILELAGKQKAS